MGLAFYMDERGCTITRKRWNCIANNAPRDIMGWVRHWGKPPETYNGVPVEIAFPNGLLAPETGEPDMVIVYRGRIE